MKTQTDLIRRCRWCELRTGKPSYFVNDEWQPVLHPQKLFGDEAQFTDGICPDCHANEIAKLNKLNLKD